MSITLRRAQTISNGVTLRGHTPPPPPIPIVTDGLVLHYDFSNPACYSGGTTNGTGTASY